MTSKWPFMNWQSYMYVYQVLYSSCKASKSRVAMIQKSFCITVENVCIIEFLTGSTLVACLSIFCNVTAEKGFPFLYFLRWSNIFLVFFIRVHNSCLAAANGAFVSIKIVFSNHFSTVFRLCKNCFDKRQVQEKSEQLSKILELQK